MSQESTWRSASESAEDELILRREYSSSSWTSSRSSLPPSLPLSPVSSSTGTMNISPRGHGYSEPPRACYLHVERLHTVLSELLPCLSRWRDRIIQDSSVGSTSSCWSTCLRPPQRRPETGREILRCAGLIMTFVVRYLNRFSLSLSGSSSTDVHIVVLSPPSMSAIPPLPLALIPGVPLILDHRAPSPPRPRMASEMSSATNPVQNVII